MIGGFIDAGRPARDRGVLRRAPKTQDGHGELAGYITTGGQRILVKTHDGNGISGSPASRIDITAWHPRAECRCHADRHDGPRT